MKYLVLLSMSAMVLPFTVRAQGDMETTAVPVADEAAQPETRAHWYDSLTVGAFADAYYMVDWNRPEVGVAAQGVVHRAYDAASDFNVAFAGLDLAYAGENLGSVIQLYAGYATGAGSTTGIADPKVPDERSDGDWLHYFDVVANLELGDPRLIANADFWLTPEELIGAGTGYDFAGGVSVTGQYAITDEFALASRVDFIGNADAFFLQAYDNLVTATLTADYRPVDNLTIRLDAQRVARRNGAATSRHVTSHSGRRRMSSA